jgi:hypothetical protein
MTSSTTQAVSGLSALDQAIESLINAKPQAQTSALPQDTVTLSTAHSAAPASSVSAAEAQAKSPSGTAA